MVGRDRRVHWKVLPGRVLLVVEERGMASSRKMAGSNEGNPTR